MQLLEFEKMVTLLKKYKIGFIKSKIIRAENDFDRAGYPVVLKIFSPEIIHKTEKGGVVLNLRNKQEAVGAFKKLREISKNVLMQKMVKGREIIIGMKRDPQFGPVIMFGLGGVFTEVIKDISFRICPVGKKQAGEMIKEIKSYRILRDWRGQKPVKISDLIDIIVKTSNLSLEERVEEVDFNPVIVNNRGAFVVDARIIV